ncbi:DNA-binding transcriptional regulator, GntR family [Polaromonas sp. OV174]|uniref:GntR family transcriptional regulator n=1 Tax=Polaromonas sp. OV174 TaxID=1855300 RepID=UPI0008E6B7E0|nr:GntR family transcriptional regulator [Polaromonas sp. OV174]SFB78452.1 DNA-binding transcriptional regulator, GntR family [Polaromonas sp. OV174]
MEINRTRDKSDAPKKEPHKTKKDELPSFRLAPLKSEFKTDTTQNRAYQALKTAVLGGVFYPGTVVTLAKLAEMLGTSEMPVREALKRLTAEGAFEALPNRSARVPVLSPLVVRQILELRVELESLAASQAAEHMSKHHIDQLITLDKAMAQALADQQFPLYVALNMEFHFLIYRVAGNEPLLSLIEALWLRMSPVIAFSLTAAKNAATHFDPVGLAHHANLIKALQEGNAAKARQEVRADLLHPGILVNYQDALPAAR